MIECEFSHSISLTDRKSSVVEKLIMLKNETLDKPIDVFDLFYHTGPLILLIMKFIREYSNLEVGMGCPL